MNSDPVNTCYTLLYHFLLDKRSLLGQALTARGRDGRRQKRDQYGWTSSSLLCNDVQLNETWIVSFSCQEMKQARSLTLLDASGRKSTGINSNSQRYGHESITGTSPIFTNLGWAISMLTTYHAFVELTEGRPEWSTATSLIWNELAEWRQRRRTVR